MNLPEVILAFLLPLLYITSLTGLFIYIFRKKLNFQSLLPISLISSTLFIFLFTALFHNITLGLLLTVFAALGFLVLLARDKERKQVLTDLLFTPGFAIFLLVYVFLFLLNWSKIIPLLSDSSMHWAPHVWTMWLRNDFYSSPDLSLVIHGDYPPIIQLFELSWLKTALLYKEGLLFTAIQLLSFSMLMPVFRKFEWRRKLRDWGMILLVSISLISLPLIFFVSDFYSSLEVDAALAFIFFYGIFLAVTESKKITLAGLTKLSLAITFLCLTKQMAILLAGLVGVVFVLCWAANNRHIVNRKLLSRVGSYLSKWRVNWKATMAVILIGSLPLLSLSLWSAQTVGYESPDKGVAVFHLKLSDLSQIPSILTGESGTEAQQNFSKGFIRHVFMDSGGLMLNIISGVSYMQFALLFVGAMIFMGYNYKDKFNRHSVLIVAAVVGIGWLLYCFALYSVFLFGGMNAVELNNVDTPNRYLRTYLFAMLLLMVMPLLKGAVDMHRAKNKIPVIRYFALSLIVILGLFFNKTTVGGLGIESINNHKAELSSHNIDSTKAGLTKVHDYTESTFSDPAKILVTASTDNVRHYLQYSALPSRITLLLFEKQTTQDLVCSKLKNSDFLVVGYYYQGEESWNSINMCLSDKTELLPNSVYRIDYAEELVTLSKLP